MDKADNMYKKPNTDEEHKPLCKHIIHIWINEIDKADHMCKNLGIDAIEDHFWNTNTQIRTDETAHVYMDTCIDKVTGDFWNQNTEIRTDEAAHTCISKSPLSWFFWAEV